MTASWGAICQRVRSFDVQHMDGAYRLRGEPRVEYASSSLSQSTQRLRTGSSTRTGYGGGDSILWVTGGRHLTVKTRVGANLLQPASSEPRGSIAPYNQDVRGPWRSANVRQLYSSVFSVPCPPAASYHAHPTTEPMAATQGPLHSFGAARTMEHHYALCFLCAVESGQIRARIAGVRTELS